MVVSVMPNADSKPVCEFVPSFVQRFVNDDMKTDICLQLKDIFWLWAYQKESLLHIVATIAAKCYQCISLYLEKSEKVFASQLGLYTAPCVGDDKVKLKKLKSAVVWELMPWNLGTRSLRWFNFLFSLLLHLLRLIHVTWWLVQWPCWTSVYLYRTTWIHIQDT